MKSTFKSSLPVNKILERMQRAVTDKTSIANLEMINKVRQVANALQSMESIIENQSPSETTDAHYIRVSKSAKRLRDEFIRINDQVHEILRSESESIRTQINKAFEPTKHAAEIRATIRAMPKDERNRFVLDAINSKNIEIISAIKDAPAVLSGIDSDFHGSLITSAEEAAFPDLVNQEKEMMDTFMTVQTVLGTAEKETREWLDPNKMTALDAKEQLAESAKQKFEQALQDNA